MGGHPFFTTPISVSGQPAESLLTDEASERLDCTCMRGLEQKRSDEAGPLQIACQLRGTNAAMARLARCNICKEAEEPHVTVQCAAEEQRNLRRQGRRGVGMARMVRRCKRCFADRIISQRGIQTTFSDYKSLFETYFFSTRWGAARLERASSGVPHTAGEYLS